MSASRLANAPDSWVKRLDKGAQVGCGEVRDDDDCRRAPGLLLERVEAAAGGHAVAERRPCAWLNEGHRPAPSEGNRRQRRDRAGAHDRFPALKHRGAC